MLNSIKIFTVLLCGLFAISADASSKGAVPDLKDGTDSRPLYRPSPQRLLERELAAFSAVTSRDELDRLQRLISEGLAANEHAREEARRKTVVDRAIAH